MPCVQASPSSSGVTATGPNAWAGRLCTAPTPAASSWACRLRRHQVLASISRRTPSSARAGGLAAGMSAVMAARPASKSSPWASSASGMGCNAPCMASPARPSRSGCARPPTRPGRLAPAVAEWALALTVVVAQGSSPAASTVSRWLAQAAPRRHWLARGSGARHMAGSNAKGWGARPRFSASDKSCSCGAMKLQSSSACCRVWAAPVA